MGALLALDRVDGDGAYDCLRHRNLDLLVAIVNPDGAISLLENDAFQPLLVEGRALVPGPLRTPSGIAGLTRPELAACRWLAIADLVLRCGRASGR